MRELFVTVISQGSRYFVRKGFDGSFTFFLGVLIGLAVVAFVLSLAL